MRSFRGIALFLAFCLFFCFCGVPTLADASESPATIDAPVMEKFNAHPLGKPLTVKWSPVTNALRYTAVLTPFSGVPSEGAVLGTSAIFPAESMPTLGKYTVAITAHWENKTPVTVSRAFEVLESLPAMTLSTISKHTAGQDLVVKWFSVSGASRYVATLTPPTGAGNPLEMTVDVTTVTFPGSAFAAQGTYTAVVSAQADGYFPSEASFSFPVEKRFAFGISDDTNAASDPGVNDGRTFDTTAYKAEISALDAHLATLTYINEVSAGISERTDLGTMQLLLYATKPIATDWEVFQQASAVQAYFNDYTVCLTFLLVDLATGSTAIVASEVVQITSSAVGEVLSMVVTQGRDMAPEARTALTAYRDKCATAAVSSNYDELPSLRKDVIALIMNRIVGKDKQAQAVVTAALPIMDKDLKKLDQRTLEIGLALTQMYATNLEAAALALPDTATYAQLEAVNLLYQQYMLASAHLSHLATTLGGAYVVSEDQAKAAACFLRAQEVYAALIAE